MFILRFAWSAGLLVAFWELGGSALLLSSHSRNFSLQRVGIHRLRCSRRESGVRSLHCDTATPLIEAIACRVLRLVLRNGKEAHVFCTVRSKPLDLMQGRIEGASINGRNWASRLGFTARKIAVHVGDVKLDMGALVRRRVLEFQTPHPSGEALVVFDAQDFGNFLTHRMVHQAQLAGRCFTFERTGVSVDPVSRVVAFCGTWGARDVRVELSQSGVYERLSARVAEEGGLSEVEKGVLSRSMSDYFNALEIDLDGPKLKFQSLAFEGRGRTDAKLQLRLGIVVRKLPSIQSVALF